eukprot:gene15788-17739_t
MVQILVQSSIFSVQKQSLDTLQCIEVENGGSLHSDFMNTLQTQLELPSNQSFLITFPNGLCIESSHLPEETYHSIEDLFPYDGITIEISLPLLGGLDRQHREGGKTGTGGQMSESQAALERKERLRKLALETIDITKDPYFMRNHLGTFECKLCLTLHPNEGNYLAHTQGKRHQYNLGRRAAMEAKNAAPRTMVIKEAPVKRAIKIGRPGYKVTKSRDLITKQRSITFEIDYPEAESNSQPRHRFMSAYEQKVEPPDRYYQYILFACDPYEIIAFKIPNHPVDKREGRFLTHWDEQTKKFSLQLFFVDGAVNIPNNGK